MFDSLEPNDILCRHRLFNQHVKLLPQPIPITAVYWLNIIEESSLQFKQDTDIFQSESRKRPWKWHLQNIGYIVQASICYGKGISIHMQPGSHVYLHVILTSISSCLTVKIKLGHIREINRLFQYKDTVKQVWDSNYLYKGNSYAGKTTPLYWNVTSRLLCKMTGITLFLSFCSNVYKTLFLGTCKRIDKEA